MQLRPQAYNARFNAAVIIEAALATRTRNLPTKLRLELTEIERHTIMASGLWESVGAMHRAEHHDARQPRADVTGFQIDGAGMSFLPSPCKGETMGSLSGIENVATSGWESIKRGPRDVEDAGESAWNHAVAEAKQAGRQLADPNSLTSQLGHTALDTIGMLPVVGSVAEAANAGWYAAQGDPADAALSGAAAIPIVGDAADAAHLTKDGVGIVREADSIAHDVHGAEAIAKDAGAGEAAPPVASTTQPPDPVRAGGGGGDAGGPPKGPDSPDGAYPAGLAYRYDFPQHLAGPDGFTFRGTLNGTHNLDNAKSALESRGAYQVPVLKDRHPGYTVRPTGTHGILDIRYHVHDPATGTLQRDSKTVYDPAVHSDQSILQSALKAGEKAFRQYKADSSSTRFDVNQDGIKFRAHINFDKQTGAPYVGSVRPLR